MKGYIVNTDPWSGIVLPLATLPTHIHTLLFADTTHFDAHTYNLITQILAVHGVKEQLK